MCGGSYMTPMTSYFSLHITDRSGKLSKNSHDKYECTMHYGLATGGRWCIWREIPLWLPPGKYDVISEMRMTSEFQFKMAAMTSFMAEKCCHLLSAHPASARRICSSVRQFLIQTTNTFVFVVCPMLCIAALDNIKSFAVSDVRCPMSDVQHTFVCACAPSHGRNF